MKRILLVLSALIMLPLPALADRDHRHDRGWRGHDRHYSRHDDRPRTRISVNFGSPYYYHRPYYRPMRVIYAPSPVVVAPQQQVVYINDDNSREVPSNDGRYCREYYTNANIGGRVQQTYGTACMQPDGSWEIIS